MKFIDEVDIILLEKISERQQTCFDLVKILNPNIKDNRKLTDKAVNIINRLKKLKRYGFTIEKNLDRKNYSINGKNVLFVKNSVLNCNGKIKFAFKNLVMLKDGRNWNMIQYAT